MPRQKRLRKIVAPPAFEGYKPYGCAHDSNEIVELNYEEYEAIKLADYDLLNHLGASKLMGISRPTFARIYETARRKIAKAFVETKEIKTTYGNAIFDKSWFQCKKCSAKFTIPKVQTDDQCPICKSSKIISLSAE
ncbi:DUF134 domain-containing protein [bacterium]|nr:DUF134 domain-containing protein [bacterium]